MRENDFHKNDFLPVSSSMYLNYLYFKIDYYFFYYSSSSNNKQRESNKLKYVLGSAVVLVLV